MLRLALCVGLVCALSEAGAGCGAIQSCQSDIECVPGDICGDEGLCVRETVSHPAPGEPCRADDDCGGERACVDERCAAPSITGEGEGEGERRDPCLDPSDDDMTSGRCLPGIEPAGTPRVEPSECTEAARAEGRCTGPDPVTPPPPPCTGDDPDNGRC